MSVLALRWAAEQTAGGPMRKLVLYALAEHADTSGRCHPSLSTLASETEASVATVKRALVALVDIGLVTRTPRSRGTGATTSTGYTLALSNRKPDNDDGQGSQRATGDRRAQNHAAGQSEPGCSSQGATPRLTVSPHAWLSVSQEGEPPVEPTTEPKSGSRARARGTATPAELSSTAVRPDAYRLVSTWRTDTGVAYRPATVRALAKHADGILRDGGDPAAVRAALDEWNRRPDARPGLLPHLYDDAVKARRNPGRTAVSGGLSKRDTKAAGWFALAAELAAEDAEPTTTTFDVDVLAIEGGYS